MKVIATNRGFYGRLIQKGEVFDVPDGSKASWFVSQAAIPKKGPASTPTPEGNRPGAPLHNPGEALA